MCGSIPTSFPFFGRRFLKVEKNVLYLIFLFLIISYPRGSARTFLLGAAGLVGYSGGRQLFGARGTQIRIFQIIYKRNYFLDIFINIYCLWICDCCHQLFWMGIACFTLYAKNIFSKLSQKDKQNINITDPVLFMLLQEMSFSLTAQS